MQNIPEHQGFPRELLQNTVEARQAYFFDKTIGHPRLTKARDDILTLIEQASGPDIIIVTGPTGVGKTTLAGKIENNILEHYSDRMATDRSFMPVIKVDAVPPDEKHKFDWKDFHTRLLQQFNEPCIAQKQLFQDYIYMEQPISQHYAMNTPAALKRASEKTMRMRQTSVMIIDEANHMLLLDSRYLRQQFETIKSLSQHCNTTIILIGTYDLLQILQQSAQLVRRSRVVHMSRYNDYIADDKKAFRSALNTFRLHMPFEVTPDIMVHFDKFYLRSAGCIGILKKWLDIAVQYGLESGKNTLSWEDIEPHALPNKDVKTILEEATNGETKLKDISTADLRKLLKDHHKIQTGQSTESSETESKSTKAASGKGVQKQVGKRNPKRDPVGGMQSGLGF
ncbi:TniB family NTP-binding protein [Methyloradius palustris]|uniref:ATP-binding protein n=1 Tax=Methyloradius palustris TaxID=2778876 RepID=A0A8D5G9K7_9PROT|nr:TniB family NTP-binding protein [Methyloradius palustris]BCM24151.1 ATP-binding protein [Methyloradius palustris]